MRTRVPLFLPLIFVVALVVNLAWENLQAPLYTPYVSLVRHLPLCARASVWDAGYMTVLYLGLALLSRQFFWVRQSTAAHTLLIVFVGLATAAWIEHVALAEGRWAYAEAMPQVLGVGLTPLLQLPLLSLVSYRVAWGLWSRLRISTERW